MGLFGSIGRGVKWSLKPFFEIPRWIGVSTLKRNAAIIREQAVEITHLGQKDRKETFDEAIARFGLSEQDIILKRNAFLRMALIFAGVGVLIFCYAMYLLWHDAAIGGILAFVVGLLSFGYAFRYHFWFFQIKHRKLGCTFNDWLQGKVGDNS